MTDVYVHGAGMTRFGRRNETLDALAREAVERALREAGDAPALAPSYLFVASQAPEAFTGQANVATWLAGALGLTGVPATRVETAPSSGASALEAAFFAVKSGLVETALVVGAEKMTHVPTMRVTAELAKMLAPHEREMGATMPALAALVARAYMHRHGLSREALASVPVKAHAHGARNPHAHFQREITLEHVLESPVVADPLRVYDCAPISDGAAALVLSRKPGPVKLAGIGHATDALALADRAGANALTSLAPTRAAARQAFDMAGRRPADVHVAEVHDAFSILELVNLEDLGFFPAGEAFGAHARGETALGGRLPVNPSGGLKARGHPLGATGVAQACEVFWQLTKRAEARQVDGARVGLTHAIGGFGNNNLVTLWEAAS